MNSLFDDFKNTFSKTGNGLNQLIIINIIVFVILIILKVILHVLKLEDIYETIEDYLFLPPLAEVFIYEPWTIFTYFFSHTDFFHIIFNMIFLYWFGSLITEFLGSKRLISLYILGGIVGGLLYLLAYNTIPYFADNAPKHLLGASASVYAIVVGAAVLIPDYTFFLLFLGPVKIKYIAMFYALLSFANTIGPNAGGNIAHLGGALLGALFIIQLKKGHDWGKPVEVVLNFFSSLFKPKTKIKVTYKTTENTRRNFKQNDDISQEEIDAILDKISKYGYEKLSKEEKQKLFKASQSTHI